MKFNKGDRVFKSPMWKYDKATGTVIKSSPKDGSCFIKWDDINGEWYFSEEQTKEIHLINENEDQVDKKQQKGVWYEVYRIWNYSRW